MIDVPPDLNDRWPMLVLIESRRITFTEVETVMSIDDVMDLHETCAVIGTARNAPARELGDDDELD